MVNYIIYRMSMKHSVGLTVNVEIISTLPDLLFNIRELLLAEMNTVKIYSMHGNPCEPIYKCKNKAYNIKFGWN